MAKKRQVIWSIESSRKVQSIIEYLLEEWGEKEANAFLNRLKKFESMVIDYPHYTLHHKRMRISEKQ